MFKYGICPKYEDEANKQGGDFNVFVSSSCGKLKELWETFVFEIVTQNFIGLEHLTGIRLTEKNDSWKIEFWFTFGDYIHFPTGNEIYVYLKKKLLDITNLDNINLKFNPHTQEKSTRHSRKGGKY